MYLFVYGTLKKGCANHEFLEGADYVGNYYTDNNYTLFVAGLPFMVNRAKGGGVEGEVYKITPEMLRQIDRLEGHPSFYRRELVNVTNFEDGNQLEAYTYLHPDVFNKDFSWDYVQKRSF